MGPKKALKILRALCEERKDKIKEVITVLKNDPVPFRKFDVAGLAFGSPSRSRSLNIL